jgi:hypothetical protein
MRAISVTAAGSGRNLIEEHGTPQFVQLLRLPAAALRLNGCRCAWPRVAGGDRGYQKHKQGHPVLRVLDRKKRPPAAGRKIEGQHPASKRGRLSQSQIVAMSSTPAGTSELWWR